MPAASVMVLHSNSGYYACGKCGRLLHVSEIHRGRGRHLDEHPEHDYAPCGHSLTWYGRLPAGPPTP